MGCFVIQTANLKSKVSIFLCYCNVIATVSYSWGQVVMVSFLIQWNIFSITSIYVKASDKEGRVVFQITFPEYVFLFLLSFVSHVNIT